MTYLIIFIAKYFIYRQNMTIVFFTITVSKQGEILLIAKGVYETKYVHFIN